MGPPMLTAFLDHLQHASATTQVCTCLFGALAIGVGPFAAADLILHIRAVRVASRIAR